MRTVELIRDLKKEVIAAMYETWGFAPIQKDLIIISQDTANIVVSVQHVVYRYSRKEHKFYSAHLKDYFTDIYRDELAEIETELPEIKTWDEGVAWLWQEKTKEKSRA